jgi:hypothetical protein
VGVGVGVGVGVDVVGCGCRCGCESSRYGGIAARAAEWTRRGLGTRMRSPKEGDRVAAGNLR